MKSESNLFPLVPRLRLGTSLRTDPCRRSHFPPRSQALPGNASREALPRVRVGRQPPGRRGGGASKTCVPRRSLGTRSGAFRMARSKPKSRGEPNRQAEFMQAMAESFAECVCPPIPPGNDFIAGSIDVVQCSVVDELTPSRLAALKSEDIRRLAQEFGQYFGSKAPSVRQVKDAIAVTLARWPVGSLGEKPN
jgi:hypothetical protein